jgi:hypothetical protein
MWPGVPPPTQPPWRPGWPAWRGWTPRICWRSRPNCSTRRAAGEETLAAWRTLKQRSPEELSPYFMSAFTLEALGRYREAAAEWHHIIGWLEAHDMAVHTTWPKEMLEGIEAKLAATDTDAGGAGN